MGGKNNTCYKHTSTHFVPSATTVVVVGWCSSITEILYELGSCEEILPLQKNTTISHLPVYRTDNCKKVVVFSFFVIYLF